MSESFQVPRPLIYIAGVIGAALAIWGGVEKLGSGFVWLSEAEKDHAARPVIEETVREQDARLKASQQQILQYREEQKKMEAEQERRWGEVNKGRDKELAIEYCKKNPDECR